jgi:solute carrier family 13 (sodium-dependent dicarboxylate transporter), member 2/3/5
LAMALTLGASMAFMMPVGTPPNAIVFGSGLIRIKDMMRFGFLLNIISVVLISLFVLLFL